MRTLLAAVLLLLPVWMTAQNAPKPLSIAIEPLGDRDQGIVAQVFFRFANPRAITRAGLFLEGSFQQAGQVPRNFRFAVPRKDDKFIWDHVHRRNGKVVRRSRWAVLPDKRNEMTALHTFSEGEAIIEVRLVLEEDYGRGPVLIAKAAETFTLTKTNRPHAAEAVEEIEESANAGEPVETPIVEPIEELVFIEDTAPEPMPEERGAVKIRATRGIVPPHLFVVTADVLPPVKRVEFRVGEKKVLARNAPPYMAELDLGDSADGIALRAIGFDAAGRYVDADALLVNDTRDAIGVKITRTATPDGMTHFKLTVHNPKGTPLRSVALYAGERKLQEWERPPYALSVPNASLAGVEAVRAVVVDEASQESTDVLALR